MATLTKKDVKEPIAQGNVRFVSYENAQRPLEMILDADDTKYRLKFNRRDIRLLKESLKEIDRMHPCGDGGQAEHAEEADAAA